MTMTPPTGAQEPGPSTPETQAAGMILDATERAVERILATTERAVKTITDALVAVPTALATPPAQSLDPESIVQAFEKYQSGEVFDYPNLYGREIQADPNVDILVNERGERVDQYGNLLAPNWEPPGATDGPQIPDLDRPLSDTIAPGTTLVPDIPRLDLP